MKQLIGILILILYVSCVNKSDNPRSKFKTIMIKSIGEIEALPNMATFQIDLNCLDKSVKNSKKCLVSKSNELNKKLISFGINEEDILTASINMNKQYTWIYNSRVFEGYNSSTMIHVTIRDIEKLDEIYTELLENRNLDLRGLGYSHSKLDSLKNEAYVNALRKSEILTDKLLSELPESEKEILKIGNIEITASMPEAKDASYGDSYEVAEAAQTSNNSIAISKGTVNVYASLFVEYQIK